MTAFELWTSGIGSDSSANKAIPTAQFHFHGIIFTITGSVTRLGDFLHFGQLFQAFGNN